MSVSSITDLKIFKTLDGLSIAAAELIIDAANKAVLKNGKFTMVLSGGNTPKKLFTILADKKYSKQMPWSNTVIFWGDERCVGLEDAENNSHQAKTLLLNHVPVLSNHIYVIPVNLSPELAAKKYEQTIFNYFKDSKPCFDLILLGLGENGHTASLFPDTKVLDTKTLGVEDVYLEEKKIYRITMTAPLINAAHKIVFMVSGKSKAVILKNIISDSSASKKYPAKLIKPTAGELMWFVDEDAAALLQ
ncbi:MAG: 6-phosphogluconolactonase [Bacteroidia bacterium]